MNTKHMPGPFRVLNPDNSPFSDGTKRKALIAAAPELLAALEDCMDRLEYLSDPCPAIANGRAAIAKARGEL